MVGIHVVAVVVRDVCAENKVIRVQDKYRWASQTSSNKELKYTTILYTKPSNKRFIIQRKLLKLRTKKSMNSIMNV